MEDEMNKKRNRGVQTFRDGWVWISCVKVQTWRVFAVEKTLCSFSLFCQTYVYTFIYAASFYTFKSHIQNYTKVVNKMTDIVIDAWIFLINFHSNFYILRFSTSLLHLNPNPCIFFLLRYDYIMWILFKMKYYSTQLKSIALQFLKYVNKMPSK